MSREFPALNYARRVIDQELARKRELVNISQQAKENRVQGKKKAQG